MSMPSVVESLKIPSDNIEIETSRGEKLVVGVLKTYQDIVAINANYRKAYAAAAKALDVAKLALAEASDAVSAAVLKEAPEEELKTLRGVESAAKSVAEAAELELEKFGQFSFLESLRDYFQETHSKLLDLWEVDYLRDALYGVYGKKKQMQVEGIKRSLNSAFSMVDSTPSDEK